MARKSNAPEAEEADEGQGMAARYEQNRLDAEEENAKLAENKAEDAKETPLVALGTAEAIALGVASNGSPTPGDRPEGWEKVAEDVLDTAETAGKNAETEEEAREAAEAAEAEVRSAAAEEEESEDDPS